MQGYSTGTNEQWLVLMAPRDASLRRWSKKFWGSWLWSDWNRSRPASVNRWKNEPNSWCQRRRGFARVGRAEEEFCGLRIRILVGFGFRRHVTIVKQYSTRLQQIFIGVTNNSRSTQKLPRGRYKYSDTTSPSWDWHKVCCSTMAPLPTMDCPLGPSFSSKSSRQLWHLTWYRLRWI